MYISRYFTGIIASPSNSCDDSWLNHDAVISSATPFNLMSSRLIIQAVIETKSINFKYHQEATAVLQLQYFLERTMVSLASRPRIRSRS